VRPKRPQQGAGPIKRSTTTPNQEQKWPSQRGASKFHERTAIVRGPLQELGYDVFEAENGERALKILDQYSVNLLLTDVVMPRMNGRKLADEANRRHPDLRVLFMTGYSRNAIVHQGRLDPGVDLIQKPLSTEQLASAVRRALDR
jgi:DNA-binding NtrC family response regulator